tara:strand:- start:116 stop:310 length:195 start_codon:yes stop_codon:yes gene_type:complete
LESIARDLVATVRATGNLRKLAGPTVSIYTGEAHSRTFTGFITIDLGIHDAGIAAKNGDIIVER